MSNSWFRGNQQSFEARNIAWEIHLPIIEAYARQILGHACANRYLVHLHYRSILDGLDCG